GMNQGDKSLHSTVERDVKDEEYNLSQIGVEEQHIILDDSSLGYSEYEEGGELIEGSQQYYLCANEEWMEVCEEEQSFLIVNYRSRLNFLHIVRPPPASTIDSQPFFAIQLDDGTVQYVNAPQSYVDEHQVLSLEEGEEPQTIMIDSDDLQQLIFPNQQIVLSGYEDEGMEMIEGGTVLNGPFQLYSGDVYFTFGNGTVNNNVGVKEDSSDVVYVNAKQHDRIVKRREARKKIASKIEPRKKYIHPSRHAHALARNRGEGGKFGAGKPEKGKISMKQELSNDKYVNK
ncbi:hypothetical protein PRIPAC_72354, partial [Pristionchus pacificus]